MDDILKVKKLLSDIVFCYNDGFMEHLLFHSIEYEIIRKEQLIKQKKYSYSYKESQQSIKNHYNLHYGFMIEDYLKKEFI